MFGVLPLVGGAIYFVVVAQGALWDPSDAVDNVDSNRVGHTTEARVLDKVLFHTSFNLLRKTPYFSDSFFVQK